MSHVPRVQILYSILNRSVLHQLRTGIEDGTSASIIGNKYASAVAHEIQNLRRDICCGCKTYAQDCLMMTEEEGWNMHGLAAMERVNSSPSVWHEFLNVMGALNMDVRKEFADHLMGLQKDSDRYFVEALLQVYENNRAMVDILHNLSHPPAQPLQSYETDHQKAYRKHMKNKLYQHLNKLI